MEIHNLLLFATIAFIATITPGPAILLASTHSLAYGVKSSIFTILGNITGLFIMSGFSVAGLSAIILSSSVLFTAIKVSGALYLIYLGLKLWRNGFVTQRDVDTKNKKKKNLGKLYLNGLAVALSNPKAIVFTTALFPQFIDQNKPIVLQFGILITLFMLLSFFSILFYAYTIHKSKNILSNSYSMYISKIFACGFIAAGVVLANATREN